MITRLTLARKTLNRRRMEALPDAGIAGDGGGSHLAIDGVSTQCLRKEIHHPSGHERAIRVAGQTGARLVDQGGV